MYGVHSCTYACCTVQTKRTVLQSLCEDSTIANNTAYLFIHVISNRDYIAIESILSRKYIIILNVKTYHTTN